ncbi:MAG: hypothetical protein ACTMKY_00880 [Dermabacteraceae bacterium]|uniref:hypothetical protein n=1 Tax=Brachybacterium sp. TaxID=1891286 RepID=UPI003F8F83D1
MNTTTHTPVAPIDPFFEDAVDAAPEFDPDALPTPAQWAELDDRVTRLWAEHTSRNSGN